MPCGCHVSTTKGIQTFVDQPPVDMWQLVPREPIRWLHMSIFDTVCLYLVNECLGAEHCALEVLHLAGVEGPHRAVLAVQLELRAT